MTDADELLRLIDDRIALALGGARPVEVVRGTVAAVETSTRTVLVTLDAGDTTVPAVYPSITVPEVDDEVVVLRRRDGWIMVLAVLGRDA